jgi:hypothetical protein
MCKIFRYFSQPSQPFGTCIVEDTTLRQYRIETAYPQALAHYSKDRFVLLTKVTFMIKALAVPALR